MNYQKEIEIASILAKKAAGGISDSDQKLLEEWCKNSPERSKMCIRFMQGALLPQQQKNDAQVDNQATIVGIYRKISLLRRRKIVWRAASVAAVLVLGLCCALYFYALPEKKDTPLLLADNDRPFISFNGGERIAIADSEQEIEWEKYLNIEREADLTSPSSSTGNADEIQIRIEIPRGGTYKLKLSDNSMVWLNSETVIEYPNLFKGESRHVRLIGEAFFEVEPDQNFPFIVSSEHGMSIRVTGTSFTLNSRNEDYIETVLISGQIAVKVYDGAETPVYPSQRAVIDKQTGGIVVEEVDVAPYMAWKESRIMFTDKKLDDIMEILSRWYDVEIVFTDRTIGELRFNGNLKRSETLTTILDAMLVDEGLAYCISGNRITISYGQ